MGLRFFRSVTGRGRHRVLDLFDDITRRKPEKSLLRANHRSSARNNRGVITCRHRGRGHKRLYRKVDFFRKKLDSSGLVKSLEYDPNRNSRIAIIQYEDGDKRYILVPNGLQKDQTVVASFSTPIQIGNALALQNIPLGTVVHNVEIRAGSGAKLARAAGAATQLIARDNIFTTVRLPSGEVRLVQDSSWTTVGKVGNLEIEIKNLGKAGRSRWLGRRPVVRGSAINPVDHPHGGGEGRCPIGRTSPVTPWGKPRFGPKTRRPKKNSNIFILRRKR